MVKVEFSHPDFPKGEEFDIGGILVPNGGSVDVDEDQEAAFEARTGKSLKDAVEGNAFLKVGGQAKKGGDK